MIMNKSDAQAINSVRNKLGSRLVILGHHYQHDEVITHTDYQGDSLELARKIPHLDAEYIVFCGVDFMAETAAILAQKSQKVLLPEHSASCVMAKMAPAPLVETVFKKLSQTGQKVIPLAYVNSSAAIKALCGKYGGSVCTSANAKTMLNWALEQGDQVLFLPDSHLALNTGHQLGLDNSELQILDIRKNGKNLQPTDLIQKKMLIWPGVCAVHARFKSAQIEVIRNKDPQAKIIVHPECHPDLVQMADATGSTSFIIKYVQEAPQDSRIYIGTECNLVKRLTKRYLGAKHIYPLHESFCSNMGKTNQAKLAALLQSLERAEPITVPADIREKSAIALNTMLEVCS